MTDWSVYIGTGKVIPVLYRHEELARPYIGVAKERRGEGFSDVRKLYNCTLEKTSYGIVLAFKSSTFKEGDTTWTTKGWPTTEESLNKYYEIPEQKISLIAGKYKVRSR